MKSNFLLSILFLVVLATSCTSAYRSGQTPDDVYYSPLRVMDEDDDHHNDKKDDQVSNDREEQQIRMATRNRRMRDWEDDYDYRYDPYHYGYGYGYYYNPYYYKYPVYISSTSIANPKNTTPRKVNLGTYSQNTTPAVNNPKLGSPTVQANRRYTTKKSTGGFIRNVILPAIGNSGSSGSPGNSGSSGSNNNRTYNPSSSGSSSSGSSGNSSSKPVSRPGRGS